MTLSRSRILLVDDDPLHLEVLSEWLGSFGCEVRTAPGGEQALALVTPMAFDVAVIDLQMPGIPGMRLLELLKERDPGLVVIILTGCGTMQDAIACLRQGRAFDFLLKPLADLRNLNQAIEQALDRSRQLPPSRNTAPLNRPPYHESLTPRERQTLSLLVQGLDNGAIAEQLDVSEKTVRNVLTRIYEKLKVSSRAQAIVACQQFGVV